MRLIAAAGIFAVLVLHGCGGPGPKGEFEYGTLPANRTLTVPGKPPGEADRGVRRPSSISGTAGCGQGRSTGDLVASVQSPGGARSYRVHVPAGYNASAPTPLVVNFHGSSKTALEQETYSGLAAVAAREGFILVTPEGSGFPQEWDVVGIYANAGVDDVLVTRDIVEAMKATFCIDPLRVYAAGLSNGAEMASQVGCYLPDVFAAVAAVAGVVYQGCDGRPVPVIAFHGTDDYNVPFETAQPAMAEWASHNRCSAERERVAMTGHVSRESYRGCDGADVVLYVIEGGGHTWPDAEDYAGGAGPTTHEINASDLIWEFFAKHPMP